MTRTGGVEAAVAPNGTLVYIPGTGGARRTIVSVDGSGRASPLPGLQPDIYRQLRVSPDRRRLAYSALGDIWVYEFARGQATKLTTDPASDTNPLWTPDGQRIVFTSFRAGYPEIFWRAADGTGSDERLFTRAKDLTSLFASSWSADGTQLIFTEVPGNLQSFVGQFTLGRSGDVRVLLKNNFNNGRAAISPDGRWIAYESNGSGQSEIYVERYPELGNRYRFRSAVAVTLVGPAPETNCSSALKTAGSCLQHPCALGRRLRRRSRECCSMSRWLRSWPVISRTTSRLMDASWSYGTKQTLTAGWRQRSC